MNRHPTMIVKLRIVLLLGALVMLSACSHYAREEPVGIGSGRDEYKRSPCACIPLEQLPPDERFWERLRDLGRAPA